MSVVAVGGSIAADDACWVRAVGAAIMVVCLVQRRLLPTYYLVDVASFKIRKAHTSSSCTTVVGRPKAGEAVTYKHWHSVQTKHIGLLLWISRHRDKRRLGKFKFEKPIFCSSSPRFEPPRAAPSLVTPLEQQDHDGQLTHLT